MRKSLSLIALGILMLSGCSSDSQILDASGELQGQGDLQSETEIQESPSDGVEESSEPLTEVNESVVAILEAYTWPQSGEPCSPGPWVTGQAGGKFVILSCSTELVWRPEASAAPVEVDGAYGYPRDIVEEVTAALADQSSDGKESDTANGGSAQTQGDSPISLLSSIPFLADSCLHPGDITLGGIDANRQGWLICSDSLFWEYLEGGPDANW